MNKNVSLFLLFFVFASACSSKEKITDSTSTASEKEYFTNMDGCFVLYNLNTRVFEKVIGEQRCRLQLPASSTFKVPLAVMAFDAKVLKDENQTLKWNGKKNERESDNKDHNAQTWMSESVVWFSQQLTPRIGKKKMTQYLKRFDYGNRDLSAGITNAWLISPADNGAALKISAYEQVEFIKKLWTNQLKASPAAMEKTRDLTYLEMSPKGFHLNGKTGSNFYDSERTRHLGWFIGHLQKEGQEYIVVTNFSDILGTEPTNYGGPRAKNITKQILEDSGLW